VDSIGIGAYVRNSMSYASWKKLDWYEEYAHLTVKCKVDLNIINSGQTL
jgi:spore germination protein